MNSKKIGGQYERDLAVKLSKWLTGNEDKLICWRASHSGSVGTIRNKKGLDGNTTSGDLQCLDSKYEGFFNSFFIDAKSLGNVHLMLINPKSMKSSQLLTEWKKVVSDATKFLKIPLMFVKARNDKKIPDFIIIPEGVNYSCTYLIKYHLWDMVFRLVLQDDFFKMNNWEDFVRTNTFIKKEN